MKSYNKSHLNCEIHITQNKTLQTNEILIKSKYNYEIKECGPLGGGGGGGAICVSGNRMPSNLRCPET